MSATTVLKSERITILLAEDFADNAILMKRLLEMEGYHVFVVGNGREAVEKAREIKPDFIILDVVMPIMDGLEACKIIKDDKATREIPVIFISAKDQPSIKDKAISLGAVRYFTKPVNMAQIFGFIARTIGMAPVKKEYGRKVATPERTTKIKTKDPFRICGTVLNGKYDLTEFAGSGGMGAVYRALNLIDGSIVAVKILQPHIVTRNPEYAELFEWEAKNAEGLDHPHIVNVFDSGKDEDLSYMVMEWVEGRSVEDVLTQGQLPLDRLTNIFEQICSAVAFAHQRNIIHLDLKPSNILLLDRPGLDDFVKVIDFGLSRVISKESGTTVTKFRGTHQFCAPEQFGGKVSHRSDIYSLGATLYYLLTGVIPFGTSYINAKIHPNLELPEIPSITRQRDVPSELDFVLRKALNKSPNLRQQSALELFEEFSAAFRGALLRPDSDVYYTIRFKGTSEQARAFGAKLESGIIWTWRHPDKDGYVEVDVVSQASNIENLFWAIAGSVGIDLTRFLIKQRRKALPNHEEDIYQYTIQVMTDDENKLREFTSELQQLSQFHSFSVGRRMDKYVELVVTMNSPFGMSACWDIAKRMGILVRY